MDLALSFRLQELDFIVSRLSFIRYLHTAGSEALLPKLSAMPTIRNLRKYPLGTILPLSSLSGDEQTRETLTKLLERNCFKRSWIFQEVIVTSGIDIMCGTCRQPSFNTRSSEHELTQIVLVPSKPLAPEVLDTLAKSLFCYQI